MPFGLGRALKKGAGHAFTGFGLGSLLGGGGRGPRAPDPYAMANQQLSMNRDAAFGSLINQSGPFGSVNYSRNADGSFNANTTLDPAAQRARDIAGQRLGMFSSHYGEDRQRIEDELYKRYSSRLDPEYGERERALMSRLEAQGVTQGSQAFQKSMDDLSRDRRSAYDEARTSSILGGGQEQSRQLDEISSLFGLSSANAPQAVGHAGIGAPDLMGAIMAQYGIQQGAHNADQQGRTALLSALIGGAGMLGGGGP